MGAPVQLPDLPVATVANNGDTTLLRQGLTDFQCSVALLRNIDIPSLSQLSGPANAISSDLMLISRTVMGTPTNFQIPFAAVGLPLGTKSWFYMTSSQIQATLLGWQPIPNTGDSLLAVSGGSTYNSAGTTQGSWTLPSITLGIQNIPQHQHYMPVNRAGSSGSSNTQVSSGVSTGSIPDWIQTFSTGGHNSTRYATNPDSPDERPTFIDGTATDPYALGNSWRPFASVGTIAQKTI